MTWTGSPIAVHQLRDAARTVLQTWLPTALADVAADSAADVPNPPQSWRRIATFDQVPEAQLPAVYVAAPSTVAETAARNDAYAAAWELQVVAAVRGRDYEATATAVSVYAAAIRAVLVQRPLGLDATVRWQGEVYDVAPAVSQRTLAATLVTFQIHVPEAVRIHTPMRQAGSPADGPAPPTVEAAQINVNDAGWTNESS